MRLPLSIIWCTAISVFCLAGLFAGCNREPAKIEPVAKGAASVRSVRVERLKETESILRDLGFRSAWIYKYSGRPVYAKWQIFHRPAGKDSVEKKLFESDTTGAATMEADWLSNEKTSNTADIDPSCLMLAINDDSLTFAIRTPHASVKQVRGLKEVFPKAVLEYWSSGKHSSSRSETDTIIELQTGDTKIPIEEVEYIDNISPKSTADVMEVQRLKFVLTVSAIKPEDAAKSKSQATGRVSQ